MYYSLLISVCGYRWYEKVQNSWLLFAFVALCVLFWLIVVH
jgi:hypothetical protein